MREYTHALINEIREFAGAHGKIEVDTVYFGGGTPSLLPLDCFSEILGCIRECFLLFDGTEITAEANPKTADADKLSGMRALGINRLSIGMQSVHDDELRALGRLHGFADFCDFFENSRAAGFDNISVDLMYGIPRQSMKSFEESMRTLVGLSPEHISSYCLKIEEGTRFYEKRDSLILPDEDTVSDMYLLMSEYLKKCGYNKYEISNFSKEGLFSRHNTKYWTGDEYVGFGSGAHSYVSGKRFCNSHDIDGYIASCGLGEREDIEEIDEREREREFVMLGMRLACGVNIDEFEKRFHRSWEESYGIRMKKFSPEYVNVTKKNCSFTDKGMLVSNYILSEVLDF